MSQQKPSECALCTKMSRRKCVLCGLFWHPSCCDIAMRTVTTDAMLPVSESFPTMDMLHDLIAPLGSATWDKFNHCVVKVRKEPTLSAGDLGSSSHAAASSAAITDVSMILGRPG